MWEASRFFDDRWSARLLGVLLDLLVFLVVFLTVVTFTHDHSSS